MLEAMPYERTSRCPCLSGEVYGACCGPFHEGAADAPTAVRLMRSRYSAFAVLDAPYLLRTWAAATRPSSLDLDPALRWISLEIVGSTRGALFDTEGTVEFVARYRTAEGVGSQHEISRFVRDRTKWVYLGAV